MKTQHGNALFLILIAVALFAALSYAVTQSGRGGGNVNRETVMIQTANLVQLLDSYAQTVQRMLILGCDITEISFEGAFTPNTYSNGNSPTDNSCHVFEPEGGGMSYVGPNTDVLDSSFSAAPYYGEVSFARNNNINLSTGWSTNYGVEAVVAYVTEDVCLEMNQQLHGISTIPADADDSVSHLTYIGTPSSGGSIRCDGSGLGDGNACGGLMGCMLNPDPFANGSPGYAAYVVLMDTDMN